MDVGYIQFNNKNSYEDFGIKILDEVIVPFPVKKKIKQSMPGGDGNYYIETGGYEDISIPFSFEVLDKEHVNNKYREIKRWLDFIEDNRLFIFDNHEYFYKVKSIEIPSNFETVANLYGVFKVNFICDPYSYLISACNEIDLPHSLYNSEMYEAKPIFRVVGEGLITLTINSKEVTINVGGEVIIDVDKQLVLRNGNIENTRKTGSWDNLIISPGVNTINITGGIIEKATIVPNFKTI